MRPAFLSPRSAVGFTLLVGLLVAGPALAPLLGLVDESRVYPGIDWHIGEFPWIQRQVFEQKGDIDIAFMGSSHLWAAIATPTVQRALSRRLGREASVVTLGWNWSGYDALYSVTRNLLDHRRVHTIVVYDENIRRLDVPHPLSYRMIQIGAHPGDLADMPLPVWLETYSGSIIGLPRHLLSFIRRDRLEDPAASPRSAYLASVRADNPFLRGGSLRSNNSMGAQAGPLLAGAGPVPADVTVSIGADPGRVAYSGIPLGPYQAYFARKFAVLCRERGVQVVALHIPVSGAQNEVKIAENQPLKDVLGYPAPLVGIAGARLFSGVPAGGVAGYFYETDHLNARGQDLFTGLVTPSIVRLYAERPQAN